MRANEIKKYYNHYDYLNYLSIIDTEQVVCDTRDIEFVEIDGCLHLVIGNEEIPVRETALNTILSRMGVSGSTWKRMVDIELAECFKTLHQYLPKHVSVMISDGCVNSMNSYKYVHLPMTEIMESTLQTIQNYCRDEIKCEVTTGFDATIVRFNTDKKIKFNGSSRNLIITLMNSESGESAVHYSAFLQNKQGGKIPFMSDITVEHRGDSTIESVEESLNAMDAAITKAIKAVRRLEKRYIAFPINTIKRVGKRIGLPEKYTNMVLSWAQNLSTCTAADIFEQFSLSLADVDNCVTLDRYKNDVLKIVALDWDTYDKK